MKKSESKAKASMMFIFATLVIDAIGLGIIMPVLPDVIRKFVSDPTAVSHYYGFFISVYALLQFLSSPLLGRISDKYGRRPILLISLFGAGVDYIFMAFAPTLALLFLGRIISGISGASYTVASAYIADISNDENRAKNFGMIGAGFGLGFILGPAIGGLLAGYGSHIPFIAAAAFNILNFIFGYFVLPESLSPENRRGFQWSQLNPFRSLSLLFKNSWTTSLVIAFSLMQFAGLTHSSIWVLYSEYRYAWTPVQVGFSLTAVGVLSALSQGVLTGPFVKFFGEKKLIKYGAFSETVAFICFGLASTGFMLYVVLTIGAIFWAAHPALQSLISKETPSSEQGELQGGLMSLGSLMAVINPLVMTYLFAETTKPGLNYTLPGSPYFLSAAVFFMAWFVILRWEKRHEL